MSEVVSLKEAERRVFRTATQDGLWDVFIGCIVLQFAIGPYLTPSLGDFWGSAAFLPFLALVMLAIWLIRKHVLKPRLGNVQFSPARKLRLKTFLIVMVILNSVALIVGIWAATNPGATPGRITLTIFGLMCLVGFSLAAHFLNYGRLYVYGLMVGFSPLVGEWLYANWGASHHGFPITFGLTATFMILTGLVVFFRLLRDNPNSSGRVTPND